MNRDGRLDLGDLSDFMTMIMSHPRRSRPAPPPRSEWYRVGDLNHDKKINAADVVILEQFLAGGARFDAPLDAADTTEDGRINSEDLKSLQDAVGGAR